MIAPLDGLTVLDLGTMITGPLAAMMLGDMGAKVIKVERTGGGDPFRSFGGGLYSPHFAAFNRNKTSRVLDLKHQDGQDALADLIVDADVLIENFRPGVMDRLGFSRDRIKALNERLVHCSITGFGTFGPDAGRPAYDTVGQALSGIAGLAVDPEAPNFAGTTVSDNVTGMYACYAVMAALIERNRTGQGRLVEVNMIEASAAFMPDAFMNHELLNLVNGPHTRVSFSQAHVFRCADGNLLALHLSSPDKFWDGLLAAMEASELGQDPRFDTRPNRVKNYLELSETLSGFFAKRDRADWTARLTTHDVPHAKVNRVDEVFEEPQFKALESFRDMDLPDGRTIRALQSPVRFDGERPAPWDAAPAYPTEDAPA